MSNNRIATVIAHSALAFSSCWTFTDLKLNFASVGLFLYLVTGVFGAIIHGIGDSGRTSYKVYSNLWLYSLALGLPSISSQLYVANSFCTEISVLHFLPPCLFIACNLCFKRTQFLMLEMMLAIYLLAVCYVSFLSGSYYGFALVISYAIAFYAIGLTGTIQNAPAKDLLSISLVFSNFFTIRTLKGN